MTDSPTDLRRFVAFKALGAYRLLLDVHSSLEDLEGCVESGQFLTAALQARVTLMRSLSVRSLAVGGEFSAPYDGLAYDPFLGLDSAEVNDALVLAERGVSIAAEEAAEWAVEVRAHVDETERHLGFDEPLRSIRTPNGLYPALRIARNWLPAADALGLPPVLPAAWTTTPQGEARDEP